MAEAMAGVGKEVAGTVVGLVAVVTEEATVEAATEEEGVVVEDVEGRISRLALRYDPTRHL